MKVGNYRLFYNGKDWVGVAPIPGWVPQRNCLITWDVTIINVFPKRWRTDTTGIAKVELNKNDEILVWSTVLIWKLFNSLLQNKKGILILWY